MPPSSPPLDSAVDATVLLVLLPPEIPGAANHPKLATAAALRLLQSQLGSAIRVLVVDETSHPTVVRSFRATDLPSFVLVRQGVELWRQRGLPEGELIVPLLLSRLRPTDYAAPDIS